MFENGEQSEEKADVMMAWQEEKEVGESALQKQQTQMVETGESGEDEKSSGYRSFISSLLFGVPLIYLIFCWKATLKWSKQNVVTCSNISKSSQCINIFNWSWSVVELRPWQRQNNVGSLKGLSSNLKCWRKSTRSSHVGPGLRQGSEKSSWGEGVKNLSHGIRPQTFSKVRVRHSLLLPYTGLKGQNE